MEGHSKYIRPATAYFNLMASLASGTPDRVDIAKRGGFEMKSRKAYLLNECCRENSRHGEPRTFTRGAKLAVRTHCGDVVMVMER